MRRIRDGSLAAFDPEIERTLRGLRARARMEANDVNTDGRNEGAQGAHDEGEAIEVRRTLRQYSTPSINGMPLSIDLPQIHVENFELKPGILQMVQANKFGGSPMEDPNQHLNRFLHLCSTFRYNRVSDDAIRLRLFPFSLRDKAWDWLYALPHGCITTWEELVEQFLAKYFPPMKTVRLRNQIATFTYQDGESLYESWEKFKDLLRKCPHHGFPLWILMQTFYSAMPPTIRANIDAAAGGALMNKEPEEAQTFIELLANNDYQWYNERGTQKKAGVFELDALNALSAQMALITKKLDSVGLQGVNATSVPNVANEEFTNGNYQEGGTESLNYVNFNKANNPFSNVYNPGWRNHPNFGWRQDQGQQNFNRGGPPGFQQQQVQQPQQQPKKPSLEDMFAQYMSKTDTLLQNQQASIKNLEVQVGQMAQALSQRSQGALPSDTESNPRREGKEHVKAITLRSGKELHQAPQPQDKGGSSNATEKEKELARCERKNDERKGGQQDKEKLNPPKEHVMPPLPFPQKALRKKLDAQFARFLEILKQLHITIPFSEALKQMPTYAKFMKEVLTNKRKLGEHELVELSGSCSAILQQYVPPKLKDPGSFTIPCTIGSCFTGKALCDLGASINLMPYSIFKKLGLGECKPTSITLQLADWSITRPRGVIEDAL